MTCEYQGEESPRSRKHKCNHSDKPKTLDYCENICLFRKCPLGVVNP